MTFKKIILPVLAFFGFSIQNTEAQKKVYKADLDQIVQAMSGGFSSESQSKTDSAFFHISLKMRPLWPDNKEQKWLYVEQAMASALNKPYRQRLYKVELLGDTAISSSVFELPNPSRFIGGTEALELLKNIPADSLINRIGCSIILKKVDENIYAGSTVGKKCLSSLRGATYATSKVTITKEKIESWDQGWDQSDKQVWGAVKGGYIFEKKKNW